LSCAESAGAGVWEPAGAAINDANSAVVKQSPQIAIARVLVIPLQLRRMQRKRATGRTGKAETDFLRREEHLPDDWQFPADSDGDLRFVLRASKCTSGAGWGLLASDDAATIELYLNRAEELRAIAADMKNAGARELLLRVAADYEKLAAALQTQARKS
jgi:hypothetical protein